MSLANMMKSLGTLQRASIGQAADKGTTQSYADVAGVTDIPCDVQKAGMTVIMLYGQRNVNVSHTIYFYQNIDAQVNDRFVVVDQDGSTRKFNIRGFNKELYQRPQSPYTMDVELIK